MEENKETKIEMGELEEKASNAFSKMVERAKTIISDASKTEDLLAKAFEKLKNNPVFEGLEEVPYIVKMIKSWAKKEYKEVPVGTILASVAAVAYWVSPIDIIPDSIPGVGYIDDIVVVGYCIKFIKSDLDEYKEWLKGKGTEKQ